FGYPPGALDGHPVRLLGLSAAELRAYSVGSVHEAVGVRRDGSQFPIQVAAAGPSPPSGNEIVSTIRDLSSQKGLERQLRVASGAATMAEERERRRLAADLHDDVGQLLSLAGLKLGMLGKASGSAAERLHKEVAELVAHAHQRTESLMFQLSPPILQDMGL